MKKSVVPMGVRMCLAWACMVLVSVSGSVSWAEESSTWDTIQARKSVRLGVEATFPWDIKDPKTNQWTGVKVKFAQAIAETLGVELEIVEVTSATLAAALQAGQVDLVITGVTPQRAVAVDFVSTPILYLTFGVLLRDDLAVTTWDDVKPLTIGVKIGSSGDEVMTKLLPETTIQRYEKQADLLAAFQFKKIDGCVASPATFVQYQIEKGGKIVIPTPFILRPLNVAVRKEADQRWLNFLNTCSQFYYISGAIQTWYEEVIISFGQDPAKYPPIMKEQFE